jgi:hypothetical protein
MALEISQKEVLNESIKKDCVNKKIIWRNLPPTASHMAGKHERAVRSVRELIRASIGTHKLLFADLHYLIKRFESILNDRPISAVHKAHNQDEIVLTPAHALIGRPINTLMPLSFPTKVSSTFQSYKIKNLIEENFWKKFYKNHIFSIANRSKWFLKSNNLKTGDIVLMVDDQIPVLNWRPAIIKETHPDKHGVVRVVTLKTSNNHEFQRPVHKLVLLLSEDQEENNSSLNLDENGNLNKPEK